MRRPLLLVLIPLVAATARADEGMWTFNNFPTEAVQKKYGFQATPEWLGQVRLASARLAGGCSGSFVSPQGLVMTNHHCARECIEQLSTAKRDYTRDGFLARTLADERRCPTMEVNRLLEIRDVTQDVQQATRGLEGEKFEQAQRAVFAKLEGECAQSAALRCEVVTLYQGGRYDLYKYQRMQDVRLVFAPEEGIAFFGGDPDNFEFPRYDFDTSFVRVYEDGKPARTEPYFRWSPHGVKEGQLTFVSGNPGSTSRLDTLAELAYQRDFALPERLFWLAELRGQLTQFARRGPEFARTSEGLLFGVENSYKALRGRRAALVDERFWEQLAQRERELRDKVNANPQWKQQYGGAWDAIAQAQDKLRPMRKPLRMLEQGAGSGSDLFAHARALVRATEEQKKPNEQRLREYTESKRPALEQELMSTAPVHPQVEELTLAFYLSKLREELSPDSPVVRQVLGNEAPEAMAARLVKGTRLGSPEVRKQLYEGGAAAVAASKDPMIVLARELDGPAREVRRTYENEVESVLKRNSELIGQARFAVYGTRIYPDATFTPRLSYGSVQGYTEDGKQVAPFTDVAGLYARATGQPPFKLPPSWVKAKPTLNPKTPMNYVTTNDIIGGNSGSPVINQDLQIVGLVFDGNIQSLGGDYGFDAAVNRTVAVDSEILAEGLAKVYGAQRLVKELGISPDK
ncbi:S46 family peptidase [Myxococcaceae bacterium JPH2]|nr:S46 family peptidase [Myxococcaceae bacterium JPH2]